ncbi:MAG: glycosyltransferase family 39 protein, partial [candidate division WWE3 bacterium]|nr:glycosyltransferase family 39 protein [candidate division WWE3 bacterium]
FENLKFGFYLLIAVLPLLHKETFSLVIWDLLPVRLVLATLGLVGATRLVVWLRKTRKFSDIRSFLKDPVLLGLLALFVLRVLSLFNSLNLLASLKLLVFFGGIILFYIFFKYLVKRDTLSFIKTATNLYVWVALITGILAIFQLIAQEVFKKTIGGVWVVPGHLPRIGSTFWDVNHYGGYLITVIPLALVLSFSATSKAWKRWWAGVSVFLSFVLVLTQSRSAWLGMVAGIIVLLGILWFWGQRKRVYAVILILVIGFLGYFNFITLQNQTLDRVIGGFIHTRIDSFDTHFTLLSASSELMLKYPWIGSGYGSFSEHLKETSVSTEFFDKDNRLGTDRVPSHSVWGEVMAETGIPGIVVYSLLMLVIIGYSLLAALKTPETDKKLLQLGFLASTVAILVSGIFYSYNIEFYWWTLFGSFLLSIVLLPKLNNFSYFASELAKVKWLPVVIILVTFGILVYLGLNNTHVIDWDEAIYAQVSRNIANTGHWLTLQWYAGYTWFEKPPLYMWLTAPLISLWGNTSLAARFWSAAAGLGGILVTYLIGSKLFNRLTGFVSAAMLMATVHYLYYSRNGTLDVSVTLFITLTIYFFIRARESGKALDWALTGVAVGLGVMTKDIIGLLGLGVVVVFALLDYFWLKNKKPYQIPIKCYLLFVICFLIVALPWHIIMTIKWGHAFWDVYFVGHVFGRAFSDVQGKTQPFFWYLTVIKVSFRIWCLPLLASIPFLIRGIIKKDWRYLLLGVWVSAIFLFFSISRSKLIWYLIPIYPVLAIIAGSFWDKLAKTLAVMYNWASPYFIRVFICFAIFIASLSYVFIMKDRIYYQDFNLHIYQLLKAKDERFGIDRTVYYAGLADPAIMYISKGPVVSVTKGNIEEIGSRRQESIFIMPQDLYRTLKKDGFNMTEVVEWGGFSLVDKHKNP